MFASSCIASQPLTTTRELVFSTFVNDNLEIFALDIDDLKQINLTNDPAMDGGAVWSPDGKKIAFISYRKNHWGLYTMNPDGSNQTYLTTVARDIWGPFDPKVDLSGFFNPGIRWLPSGHQIAFLGDVTGSWEVSIINTDGTGITSLTSETGIYTLPFWSPDGAKMAFEAPSQNNKKGIFVSNTDGSNWLHLIDLPNGGYLSGWSPDGSKIALVVISKEDGNTELYAINADGSNPTNLTRSPAWDRSPVWSPDSTQIAFISAENSVGSDLEIYVVNVDGSGKTNLTHNLASDTSPCWSPDGKQIAFTSDRDGNFEIYLMNSDGTGQTNLTNTPTQEEAPIWRP